MFNLNIISGNKSYGKLSILKEFCKNLDKDSVIAYDRYLLYNLNKFIIGKKGIGLSLFKYFEQNLFYSQDEIFIFSLRKGLTSCKYMFLNDMFLNDFGIPIFHNLNSLYGKKVIIDERVYKFINHIF